MLSEETAMDKTRAEGAAQKTGGRIKEAAGKLTGDSKLQAEGKADKASGTVKNVVGGIKDAVKDAGRKR
jgi:uncharacterized protein YjbJ (UPF0337 family)